MPLELLRSTHPSGAMDEELSPTDCSEDSVEIRSPRPISHGVLRPNAILAAAQPPSSSLKRANKHWMDSEQPQEKRTRRFDSYATGLSIPPPPLTPFAHYPPPAGLSALKLANSNPHDLLLMEADRNRLLHHWINAGRMDDIPSWMRTNWPLIPPVPSAEAAHLMSSALHYYPHLLQSYNLPPPSPLMAPPFIHPPPMYLSYGLPLYHHRPLLAGHNDPPMPRLNDKIDPPVLSPIRAGSVTPITSLPPPLPPISVASCQSPEKEASARLVGTFSSGTAAAADQSEKKSPTGRRSSMTKTTTSSSAAGVSQVRMKKQRKLPNPSSGLDGVRPEKAAKSQSSSSVVPFVGVENPSSRETRMRIVDPEEESEASWTTRPAFREQTHLPGGQVNNNSPSISNRNYKNMTRERRMQANARERTRVHTISAAFEALRRAVPSFSHGQRLSKLSILRVASAYIAALGQLAGDDQDQDTSARPVDRTTLVECVDRCTRTLMTEGQMLRRKRSGPLQQPNCGEANATDDDDDDD